MYNPPTLYRAQTSITYPRGRLLHYLVSGLEILQDSKLPKQASINAFLCPCCLTSASDDRLYARGEAVIYSLQSNPSLDCDKKQTIYHWR